MGEVAHVLLEGRGGVIVGGGVRGIEFGQEVLRLAQLFDAVAHLCEPIDRGFRRLQNRVLGSKLPNIQAQWQFHQPTQ